jgi:hypothetical protein
MTEQHNGILVSSKGGNISAATLISETAESWVVEIEKVCSQISKTDNGRRAFKKMSEALEWSGTKERGLIKHFKEKEEAEALALMTHANATHHLMCSHSCKWTKLYAMRCHVLKTTKSGQLKVLVFGERNWKGREHLSRVRYVEPGRIRPMQEKAEQQDHAPAI